MLCKSSRVGLLRVLLLSVLLASCGGASTPTQDAGVPSLGEYQSAFAAFVECAGNAGGAVEAIDTDAQTGIILYRAQPPEVGGDAVLEECYDTNFRTVEMAYSEAVLSSDGSLLDMDREFLADSILPCLEANGIEREMPQTYGSDYREVSETFVDLDARGLCPTH